MDYTSLTYDELKDLYIKKMNVRSQLLTEIDSIALELEKKEKFEALKNQFSGLTAEEFEAVRNSLFLSPKSIESEEKAKI